MHISTQMATFNYHGGKFSYLPWLMPLTNVACKHRIDVFGGSAVWLLNQPPAPIETYNDINGRVVNFFRVLRDKPDELIPLLEMTPHSKKEYDDAWFIEEDTDVEAARKFFVRTQQSIWAAGAQEKVKGWAASLHDSRCKISEKTHRWLKSVAGLQYVVERLKQVQIECRDFRFIMKHYDGPDTFFYLDSPYDSHFRSSTAYTFDFKDQDFIDMHYWAARAKGKVAISGYNTPFMQELFKDFNFHHGPKRKNNRSVKEAYECLWTNY